MNETSSEIDEIPRAVVPARTRVSAQRRAQLLAEYDRRGASVVEFATYSGINSKTLWAWLRKRRAGVEKSATLCGNATGRWVEAVVTETLALPGNSVVVELPGNARVKLQQGDSVSALASLLRELEQSGGQQAC